MRNLKPRKLQPHFSLRFCPNNLQLLFKNHCAYVFAINAPMFFMKSSGQVQNRILGSGISKMNWRPNSKKKSFWNSGCMLHACSYQGICIEDEETSFYRFVIENSRYGAFISIFIFGGKLAWLPHRPLRALGLQTQPPVKVGLSNDRTHLLIN